MGLNSLENEKEVRGYGNKDYGKETGHGKYTQAR